MQEKNSRLVKMKGVSRSVFLRSFFLETVWNYTKLQNLGFLFNFCPALNRLFPNKSEYREAVLRHLDAVNTHPAMGPLLIGLTARMETDLDKKTVISYRKRIMAALAAHGDRLFWGNIRPLASLWGVIAGIGDWSAIGSAVTLLLYNTPSLLFRYYGFDAGWKHGLPVLQWLKSWRMEFAIVIIRALAALGLGVLTGLSLIYCGKLTITAHLSITKSVTLFAILTIVAFIFVAVRRRFHSTLLLVMTSIISICIYLIISGNLIL